SATTFSSPGDIMYGVTDTPVRLPLRVADMAMRGSVSSSVRDTSSPVRPERSGFQSTLSDGVRFDRPVGWLTELVTPSIFDRRCEIWSSIAVHRFHSA